MKRPILIAGAIVLAVVPIVLSAVVLNFLWVGYSQGTADDINAPVYWEKFAAHSLFSYS